MPSGVLASPLRDDPLLSIFIHHQQEALEYQRVPPMELKL